jgi:predicted RecB family nuclease
MVPIEKMVEKEANNYHLYDNEGKDVKLEQSDGEKDIGVLVDETISFSTHIQNQIVAPPDHSVIFPRRSNSLFP